MNEFEQVRKQVEMQIDGQSQLQEEASQAQGRLVAPQLREQMAEAQAAIIAQTNPAKSLKIVLDGFKGVMYDEHNTPIHLGQPMMNEKGISRIASMLIPFVNDPIRFGHISKVEVRNLSLEIANDITEDIGLNWRDYGIKDPSHKDIIVDALITLIFITLTRSEEGGERRFFTKVILESVGGGGGGKKKKEDSGWGKLFKL